MSADLLGTLKRLVAALEAPASDRASTGLTSVSAFELAGRRARDWMPAKRSSEQGPRGKGNPPPTPSLAHDRAAAAALDWGRTTRRLEAQARHLSVLLAELSKTAEAIHAVPCSNMLGCGVVMELSDTQQARDRINYCTRCERYLREHGALPTAQEIEALTAARDRMRRLRHDRAQASFTTGSEQRTVQ